MFFSEICCQTLIFTFLLGDLYRKESGNSPHSSDDENCRIFADSLKTWKHNWWCRHIYGRLVLSISSDYLSQFYFGVHSCKQVCSRRRENPSSTKALPSTLSDATDISLNLVGKRLVYTLYTSFMVPKWDMHTLLHVYIDMPTLPSWSRQNMRTISTRRCFFPGSFEAKRGCNHQSFTICPCHVSPPVSPTIEPLKAHLKTKISQAGISDQPTVMRKMKRTSF